MKHEYSGKKYLDDAFHMEKIGSLVEEMENILRMHIEEIYLKKSKEVK
jgi:hypothetical protein